MNDFTGNSRIIFLIENKDVQGCVMTTLVEQTKCTTYALHLLQTTGKDSSKIHTILVVLEFLSVYGKKNLK